MTIQCLLISIVMFKNTSRSKQYFYTIEIVQLYIVLYYILLYLLYIVLCVVSLIGLHKVFLVKCLVVSF